VPKAAAVVDFVRKRITVTLASADFPAPPTTDTRLLLELMRGPVHGDPTAIPTWKPRAGTKPRRVLAVARTWDFGPLPPEVDEPFRAALDAIDRDLGLPVEEIEPSSLFPTAVANGGEPGLDWFVTVTAEELAWLGRDFVQANLEEFSAPFRFEMENALLLTLDDYLRARHRRFDYVLDLDRLLGDDSVLVCPTHGYQGGSRTGRCRVRTSRRAPRATTPASST
jgi:amidase/aspartyl-tRNA(Asn)/glutamyl-tRNA(Gln) amidotransferase subunit A